MRSEPSPVTRWLLVLVISAGVVAMHSVVTVGACAGHGGRDAISHPGNGQFSSPHHAGHPGPAEPSDGSARFLGTGATSAPTHGDDTGWCSPLGHLCLAVISALGLVVILGLIMMAAIGRRPADLTATGAAALGARSPPVGRPPSRTSLTELCVSRR